MLSDFTLSMEKTSSQDKLNIYLTIMQNAGLTGRNRVIFVASALQSLSSVETNDRLLDSRNKLK